MTSDYLNFFAGDVAKTSGYPWTPTETFTPNGFGGFNTIKPAGSYYAVSTPGAAGVDFNLSNNSLAMFSRTSYGSSTITEFAMFAGATTGLARLWDPCVNNTLTASLNQSRVISVPGGGWGAVPGNSVTSYLNIAESGGLSNRVVLIAPRIEYDRATGEYDNYIAMIDQAGTVTGYPFGTTSTSAADVEIKLIITPVAPTTTSPVRNRWNIEFDVTGDGTSITIPSYEFELPYGEKFAVDQLYGFSCSTSAHDKYKISDVTLTLTDTVIP